MKNEIKEYFKARKADVNDRCGHPYYNDSMLKKVGNKYLYFLYKNESGKFVIIKKDMNAFFAAFCKSGF